MLARSGGGFFGEVAGEELVEQLGDQQLTTVLGEMDETVMKAQLAAAVATMFAGQDAGVATFVVENAIRNNSFLAKKIGEKILERLAKEVTKDSTKQIVKKSAEKATRIVTKEAKKVVKTSGKTTPKLPPKIIAQDKGIEIKHYTKSGDHAP